MRDGIAENPSWSPLLRGWLLHILSEHESLRPILQKVDCAFSCFVASSAWCVCAVLCAYVKGHKHQDVFNFFVQETDCCVSYQSTRLRRQRLVMVFLVKKTAFRERNWPRLVVSRDDRCGCHLCNRQDNGGSSIVGAGPYVTSLRIKIGHGVPVTNYISTVRGR